MASGGAGGGHTLNERLATFHATTTTTTTTTTGAGAADTATSPAPGGWRDDGSVILPGGDGSVVHFPDVPTLGAGLTNHTGQPEAGHLQGEDGEAATAVRPRALVVLPSPCPSSASPPAVHTRGTCGLPLSSPSKALRPGAVVRMTVTSSSSNGGGTVRGVVTEVSFPRSIVPGSEERAALGDVIRGAAVQVSVLVGRSAESRWAPRSV